MKKKIGRTIDRLLSIVIIVILLPLFITTICQRMQLENVIYGEVQSTEQMTEAKISRVEDNSKEIEQQVLAIVANEISMDASKEAILTQCVIARTNLYDAKARKIAEPVQMDIEDMRTLWGEKFEEIHSQLEKYVAETKNQVLSWKGSYIYAAYHAISAGWTRDITEVYADADMPYLCVLSCNADVTAEEYLSISYEEQAEFIQKCSKCFPENPPQNVADIVVKSRDEAGYVQEVAVAGSVYTGEEFRSRLGLNSACFRVTELDGNVRIVTKGLGHGVGLSQYTAEHMALEGKTYKEILEYFYPGTELIDVSEIN